MRYKISGAAMVVFCFCGMLHAGLPVEKMREAFGNADGAFVLRDCATGAEVVIGEQTADTPYPPCSTFKIWNSLIGLEEGILGGPDEPFWKWDGVKRGLPGWNKDRTWREAFAVSCVPAFQELARKIGRERMQSWLEKLRYGDMNQCGRPDAFWLPRTGERTILITPRRQAELLCELVNGKLPVHKESVGSLLEVMRLAGSESGVLYGKTGSGLRESAAAGSGIDYDMGWLVGIVDSNGQKFAYACIVLGPGLSGKDARACVEAVLQAAGIFPRRNDL